MSRPIIILNPPPPPPTGLTAIAGKEQYETHAFNTKDEAIAFLSSLPDAVASSDES